jgi:hypothetical protein
VVQAASAGAAGIATPAAPGEMWFAELLALEEAGTAGEAAIRSDDACTAALAASAE